MEECFKITYEHFECLIDNWYIILIIAAVIVFLVRFLLKTKYFDKIV